jgi:hypothetical protein
VNWAILYQVGTAIALAMVLFWMTTRAVRRIGRRGLWLLSTAPLFVIAWYVLELGALVYGCVRLSGAGC